MRIQRWSERSPTSETITSRGHTVTAVYVAEAHGQPKAGDDAKNVQIFDPLKPPQLAFDHALVLSDYRKFRETGMVTPLRT